MFCRECIQAEVGSDRCNWARLRRKWGKGTEVNTYRERKQVGKERRRNGRGERH